MATISSLEAVEEIRDGRGIRCTSGASRYKRAMIVNIHHGAEYDIYIGRHGHGKPGPLGNPIAVGKACVVCGARHSRDGRLLQCYRRWLWRRLRDDRDYARLVMGCHRKRLGCFCVRADGSGPCHGKVLARAATWLADGGMGQLHPTQT
jgi:hypothetical protein